MISSAPSLNNAQEELNKNSNLNKEYIEGHSTKKTVSK